MKCIVFLRQMVFSAIVGFSSLAGAATESTASYPPMVTEALVSPFYLNPGQTRTVNIPGGWRRVQKIIIRAEGYSHRDASFEVIANGDTKGTVYVPGKDPSYIVTIAEVVNSLQVRHIGGGTATIYDIKAVMSEDASVIEFDWENSSGYGCDTTCKQVDRGIDLPVRNVSTKLSRRAIVLVDALEGYTNYKDYGAYLLPIKKAAARAYAAAYARGDLSLEVRHSLLVLKKQIDFAKTYLDDTFERSNAFELAVELTSSSEKIDALLR